MIMDQDHLCQHQQQRWSFLSIVNNRSRAWAEFIWKTSCCTCSMPYTLHNTNKVKRNRCTASVWSQWSLRIAARLMMLAKPNCLMGSSSEFILRVYSQILSHKQVFRKVVEVWCQGCLPLEVCLFNKMAVFFD